MAELRWSKVKRGLGAGQLPRSSCRPTSGRSRSCSACRPARRCSSDDGTLRRLRATRVSDAASTSTSACSRAASRRRSATTQIANLVPGVRARALRDVHHRAVEPRRVQEPPAPPGLQQEWATAALPGPTGAASGVSLAGGSSLVIFRALEAQDGGVAADRVPVCARAAGALLSSSPAILPARSAAWSARRRWSTIR